jgi:pimeloyl-ACP methyl ester carboxylesterase
LPPIPQRPTFIGMKTRLFRPTATAWLSVVAALGLSAEASFAQQRVDDALAMRLGWHEVAWSGGTLDVALVEPDPGTAGPHPVLLALPWGAGTAALVETFVASYWLTEPAARGYYVVAPEVRGSTLRVTVDSVLDAIFAWMDAELEYDADRVALVGASNGGSGAFYAAVAQPERFGAIMTLPGQYGGPPEDLAVLEGMPVYFLVGSEDERWLELTNETGEALYSHGIDAGLWVVPGQGHVLRLSPGPLLDWIDSALER